MSSSLWVEYSGKPSGETPTRWIIIPVGAKDLGKPGR